MAILVGGMHNTEIVELLAQIKRHMRPQGATNYIIEERLHVALREACDLLFIPQISRDGTFEGGETQFRDKLDHKRELRTGPKRDIVELTNRIKQLSQSGNL